MDSNKALIGLICTAFVLRGIGYANSRPQPPEVPISEASIEVQTEAVEVANVADAKTLIDHANDGMDAVIYARAYYLADKAESMGDPRGWLDMYKSEAINSLSTEIRGGSAESFDYGINRFAEIAAIELAQRWLDDPELAHDTPQSWSFDAIVRAWDDQHVSH